MIKQERQFPKGVAAILWCQLPKRNLVSLLGVHRCMLPMLGNTVRYASTQTKDNHKIKITCI